MAVWQPRLSERRGSLHERLTVAIEEDLAADRLRPGDRLPPQREAALALEVSTGTVTRAYRDAERRRLVEAHVGRGTFVRGAGTGGEARAERLDLSLNRPPPLLEKADLDDAFRRVVRNQDPRSFMAYLSHGGYERHRATFAAMLSARGLAADPGRVVICNGGQHGMSIAFAAVCAPGDLVACEAATYHGIKAVARQQGLRLRGLPMDGEGLIPDALDALCRAEVPKALYAVPTVQNPTGRTMGTTRREAVAEVARRHGLAIVESDIYAFLRPDGPPPLGALIPEHAFLVDSLSKRLSPGLRIGAMLVPLQFRDRIDQAMAADCWMASPLSAAVACEMIESGAADDLTDRLRGDVARRTDIARAVLAESMPPLAGPSLHQWLGCPSDEAERIVRRASAHGLVLTPAEGPPVADGDRFHETGVRICLGSTETHEGLEEALTRLSRALDSAEGPSLSLV